MTYRCTGPAADHCRKCSYLPEMRPATCWRCGAQGWDDVGEECLGTGNNDCQICPMEDHGGEWPMEEG